LSHLAGKESQGAELIGDPAFNHANLAGNSSPRRRT
jgi:hypothetical protein